MKISKLSIIIPCFNEAATISILIEKIILLELINKIEKEILIINDFSTDESSTKINAFSMHSNIKCYTHTENKGKGAAVKTGIQAATGDYIIIQDADLELDPEDINKLLLIIVNDETDIAFGSRFLNKNSFEGQMLWAKFGNQVVTFLTRIITQYNITDMMTCYKLIPATELKKINLVENRFGFEPEITVKLSKNRKLRFKEIPISYSPRSIQSGKKITWKDGANVIKAMFKYKFLE